MATTRPEMVAGRVASAAAVEIGAAARAITPEQFGARGDERTNGTAAFATMSAAVIAMW